MIEVTVTNTCKDENPKEVVVVRTYTDKGNNVDDGTVLQKGESHVAYLDDESFIQVDKASNESYVALSEPVAPARDLDEEMRNNADEDAAASREWRRVSKEDDMAALAAEAVGTESFVTASDEGFDDIDDILG